MSLSASYFKQLLERHPAKVTFLITATIVCCIFSSIIFSPNSVLLGTSGDAYKNYFTFVGIIKSDPGFNYHLMNHPFGENLFYLDCVPLLSWILAFLNKVFPGISDYGVGILNILMLSSIVLTGVISCKILLRLKSNVFFSILGGVVVAILAPQAARMTGHFALAFSFCIPLTWLLYLKYIESNKSIRKAFVLCFYSFLCFLLHGYLGIMCVFILVLLSLHTLLLDRFNGLRTKGFWINFAIMSFLPMFLFYFLIAISDSHIGRSKNTWGFFELTSNFDSVFFPQNGPIRDVFNHLFVIEQNWEGIGYIGLSSILLILISFAITIKLLLSKRENPDLLEVNRTYLFYILSAGFALFLAMGHPFIWKNGYLLDLIPMVKNFRAIGRFSWVFYFLITISSLYYLSGLLKAERNKSLTIFTMLILIGLFLFEGFVNLTEVRRQLARNPNSLSSKNSKEIKLLNGEKLNSSDYQAILPLPYYHIGSENYTRIGSDENYGLSMELALKLNLPLLSNYSTRTSIRESKMLLELLGPSFIKKELKDEILDSRPILILLTSELSDELENNLLSRSVLIGHFGDYELHKIEIEKLFYYNANELKKQYLIDLPSLIKDGNLNKSANFIVEYQNFNSEKNLKGRNSSGAKIIEGLGYENIYDVPVNKLKAGDKYELSFWVYNGGENYGQDILNSLLFFTEVKKKDGTQEWMSVLTASDSYIIDGNWSMVKTEFTYTSEMESLKLFLSDTKLKKRFTVIDDVLFRDKRTNVYLQNGNAKDQSYLYVNNFLIPFNNP